MFCKVIIYLHSVMVYITFRFVGHSIMLSQIQSTGLDFLKKFIGIASALLRG